MFPELPEGKHVLLLSPSLLPASGAAARLPALLGKGGVGNRLTGIPGGFGCLRGLGSVSEHDLLPAGTESSMYFGFFLSACWDINGWNAWDPGMLFPFMALLSTHVPPLLPKLNELGSLVFAQTRKETTSSFCVSSSFCFGT